MTAMIGSYLKKALTAPLAWGILTACSFAVGTHYYYSNKKLQESERTESRFFQFIESLDLKFLDFRFQLRGPILSDAPVALVAVDDASIEEIGRWPWSRSKIAALLEELLDQNVAAIGLDMVWSEPQESEAHQLADEFLKEKNLPAKVQAKLAQIQKTRTPDEELARVLAKGKERIVLGVFATNEATLKRPYQDYCRNEAFRRWNANEFVRMNATFIYDDASDPYADLDWAQMFDEYFDTRFKVLHAFLLQQFFPEKTEQSLSKYEKSYLRNQVFKTLIATCDAWLTPQDETPELWGRFAGGLNQELSAGSSGKIEDPIETFKKNVLPHPIAQRMNWITNLDLFQNAGEYSGSFVADLDADGKIRRTSLFNRTGNRPGLSIIPALALQTYLLGSKYQARITIDVDPETPTQKKVMLAQIFDNKPETEVLVANVPVDNQARMKLNFAGGTSAFPTISAKELLKKSPTLNVLQLQKGDGPIPRWELQSKTVDRATFLAGRSVILGATAIGVYDLRNTPFEKNFPGPELHVTAMANLFDQNFLKSHPQEPEIMLAVMLVGGLIFAGLLSALGAAWGNFLALFFTAILLGIDFFLFRKGIVATTVLPILLIWSIYLLLTFLKYFLEEGKKRELKSTFAKYVAPAVVDEILKKPENLELGGKKLRMTVFFSDVRGFTTMSEKLDPRMLSDILNQYLTPMTEIVFKNAGTLDKYMGDAIMAFFGAPIHHKNHARDACLCALESLEKLKEIRQEFQKRGLPDIDLGIGINTSEMSVGNMGSKIVRNYTVMGDGVNLGSRLEGLTREYGVRIIISEETYKEVAQQFFAREIDWVRVKGKTQPIKIFELINQGAKPIANQEAFESFQKAYALYRSRQFQLALMEFQKTLALNPQDPVAQVFLERCEEALKFPPPADWDGVFVMKTK